MSSESEPETIMPPPALSEQTLSEDDEPVFQRWNTIEQMFQTLSEIVKTKTLPQNFMEILSTSVGIGIKKREARDLTLQSDLQYYNLLYQFDELEDKFVQPWTLQDIEKAFEVMQNMDMTWKAKSPLPSKLPIFDIIPSENSKNPKPKPRQKHNLSDEILIRQSWEPLLGNSVRKIRSKDFLQVKAIIDKPTFPSDASHFMATILPYIVQNIKMGGSACVQSKYLSDMIFGSGTDSQTKHQIVSSSNSSWTPFGNNNSLTATPAVLPRSPIAKRNTEISNKKVPAARLDLLVTLLSVADAVLAQDIARLLGQFSIALPLIIPSISSNAVENSYAVTIPLIQTISIKRGTKDGKIFENHLFKSPFKLVVAVRLGNNIVGKSSILNHLMKDPYLFSCNQEKVADRGKPYSLPGCVELTWLTIENCKGVLWDRVEHLFNEDSHELLLLANVHGDAIEYPEIIQALKCLACSFLVFQMPVDDLTSMESSFRTFQEMIGDSIPSHYLMVDPMLLQSQMVVPEEVSIDTRNLNCMINLGKVATKLALCYAVGNEDDNPPPFKLDDLVLGERLRLSQRVMTTESQRIIDLIDKISCSGIKDKLKLQKEVVTDLKHYENAWRNDETLQELIQMIVKVLELPLRQRQIAFAHLDKEISMRSGDESRESRLLLCSLKEQRSRVAGGIQLIEDLMTNKELIDIDKMMTDASKQLERNNLGLEHFFREIGRIYEIAVHNPEDRFSSVVFNLASKVAELVIEGQVVELLDGDLGRLSGAWLNAVSHEICKIKPGLKIFVISILGLQSTGKSTLLNALFGCKFSVSSGRCTRGLFMRLLFLDDEMKQTSGIDAILLIDSEGLCAPEKMRDKDAEVRDKQMATFAMSVSHLTIINVKDEAMRDIAEILQIVVITLARLETIELAPDILLVQHGSEVDNSKFLKATSEFCEALKEAIKVTHNKFTALGILNSSCLQNLCRRVDNHEILKLFHPYKSGASANASPSIEYHEDVVDLYKKILTVMTNSSSSAVEFHKWHTLLNSCWNAVAVQNFALRFKNIQHIHEFIDRGERIANVNEAVEKTFGYHRSLLKVYIQNQVTFGSSNRSGNRDNKDFKSTMNRITDKINDGLNNTLYLCSIMTRNNPDDTNRKSSITQCDRCLVATTKISELETYVQGKEFEEDVIQTINSHIERVREHTKEQLNEALMEQFQQKYLSEDVDKVLHELILQYAADGIDYNGSDGQTRVLIVDTILDRLAQKLSSLEKVNPLAGLREKMLHETLEVYNETPIADSKNRERFLTGRLHPDHLRSVAAFPSDVSSRVTGIWQRGLKGVTRTKLNVKQSCWLEKKLNELPKRISKKFEADGFQIGMIAQLQKDVDILLEDVTERFGRLIETFKWEVHFCAIKGFCTSMELKHFQDSRKSRINALGDKADFYKKKIDACLSHGFSYNSEGRILGECFLRALRQKAKKAGDGARKHELLHQSWLANTENVRLCFFETLATQVQEGDFKRALEYFSNPKKSITSWFVNKVDSFNIKLAKYQARDNYNTEVATIWERIASSKNCNEVKDFALEYFTEVDGIQYSNELDFSKASLKNFKQFRSSLLKTIEDKCQEHFNSIVYKSVSQHKTVMDRLGCTEFCYWCGALCWGHASHEQNKDSTQKHHTCHQPQGLIGVYDEKSGKLIPSTCDSIQDDLDVRVKAGESKDGGMTWREIKMSKEFGNWIFINHAVDDFNNLMGWFFVKLNKEIASRAELLPCDDKDLKGLGLAHLDSKLDTIMTIIKQKLMS